MLVSAHACHGCYWLALRGRDAPGPTPQGVPEKACGGHGMTVCAHDSIIGTCVHMNWHDLLACFGTSV